VIHWLYSLNGVYMEPFYTDT